MKLRRKSNQDEFLGPPYSNLLDSHYKAKYPDVTAVKLNPLDHYLIYGRSEGRSPHPYFDSRFYLATYPQFADGLTDPFLQFIQEGQFRILNPTHEISTGWLRYRYGNSNTDLMELLTLSILDKTFLSPHCLFNTSYYLQQIGGIENLSGLTPFGHFIDFGADEGHNPNAWLDMDEFRFLNPSCFSSTYSRSLVFRVIHQMIESGDIFSTDICFSLKTRNRKSIQWDKGIFSQLSSIPNNRETSTLDSSTEVFQNWARIEQIEKLSESDFVEVLAEISNRSYPPKIIDENGRSNLENNKTKFLFYCHWDPANQVADWIIGSITKFHEQGFNIVFNTNIDLASIPLGIREICFVLQRANSGYDFHSHVLSWNEVAGEHKTISQLVLMNDSIFFPVSDSTELFKRLANQDPGILGMTQNPIPKSHIQSYFLALTGACIKDYLDWVIHTLDKWEYLTRAGLISTLETNVYSFAEDFNVATQVLYNNLNSGSGDVTYSDWDTLPKFGVPIMKVVVLRKLLLEKTSEPDLLMERLVAIFPKSEITVAELLKHARYVEVSRSVPE